jgi:hypothetical protein
MKKKTSKKIGADRRKTKKNASPRSKLGAKSKLKFGADISGFKAMMSRRFKAINWRKIGVYGLIGLILVGATGVFGPKVQVAAVMVIKNAVLA